MNMLKQQLKPRYRYNQYLKSEEKKTIKHICMYFYALN